ncbi:hypothetical protein ACFFRR_009417 [Megaselia abdita]
MVILFWCISEFTSDISMYFKTFNVTTSITPYKVSDWEMHFPAKSRANIRISSSIITKSIQLLAYADDIDIVTRNVEDLKTNYNNRYATSMGLRVNIEKTIYMKSSIESKQIYNHKHQNWH